MTQTEPKDPNKMTLDVIIREMREGLWAIDEMDGEVSPDLETKLDALDMALVNKAQNILHLRESLMAQSEVHKARAAQLTKISKSLKVQAERLDAWLYYNMIYAGIDKLPTPDFPKLRIAVNKPAVYVYDEKALKSVPHYWKKIDPELSKTAIAKDLRQGIHIDGAEFRRSKRLAW